MKKLLMFISVLFVLIGLVACTSGDQATNTHSYGISYRLVHKHYVGVAEVVVDENNNVVLVKLDEYFLPYSFAAVTVEDPLNLPSDVLSVVGSRGTTYFAKYVSVNATIFEGEVTGESGSQSIKYSTSGVEDIDAWTLDEENARIYVESVKAGKVFIANEDGSKSDYEKSNTNAKLGWTKSSTGYWTNPDSYPLGWGGNIHKITNAFVGTQITADSSLVSYGDSWTVDGLVTGATLADFTDYYIVVQQAYNNAISQTD
ncbi:MAG: hypothetical protein JXC31_06535 [Acholeplasmataceae bacterium]|nr:hypothetical protein [Acholeplasmataceae bacterium]